MLVRVLCKWMLQFSWLWPPSLLATAQSPGLLCARWQAAMSGPLCKLTPPPSSSFLLIRRLYYMPPPPRHLLLIPLLLSRTSFLQAHFTSSFSADVWSAGVGKLDAQSTNTRLALSVNLRTLCCSCLLVITIVKTLSDANHLLACG